MAKQAETAYKKRIVELLKQRYPKAWILVAQMLTLVGIPDLILCIGGKFVAIELKMSLRTIHSKRGRVVRQGHTLRLIQDAGGFGMFMCPENQDEVLALLDLWLAIPSHLLDRRP